jgi:hypothetical protein
MNAETTSVSRIRWWLDDSALPLRQWAQLHVHRDGSAELLAADGTPRAFASEGEARRWFRGPRTLQAA